MEVVADRLSLRWYLGYDLHEPLPDHSSLTRIRERYGLEIFRSFFDRIVQMCVEAGLVWGEELFVDSTTVRANAAKAALIPRLAVLDHLDELFEEVEEEPADATESTSGSVETANATLPGADDEDLAATNATREDFISSAGRYGTKSRSPNPNKISDHTVNRTDPDACLAGHVKGTARMGYKVHYVVDTVDTADLDLGAISLKHFQDELELELRGVAFGFVGHRFLSLFLGEKIASP